MTFAMKQIAGGVLAMAMAVSGGMAMAKAHSQNNTATRRYGSCRNRCRGTYFGCHTKRR